MRASVLVLVVFAVLYALVFLVYKLNKPVLVAGGLPLPLFYSILLWAIILCFMAYVAWKVWR